METVIARIIAIILLLIALGDLPYGFYTLLRLVVFGASAWSAFIALGLDKKSWGWILAFIALLFNPIIPIYLDKEIWTGIDSVVALILFISIFSVNESRLDKKQKGN
jgi:hypothetical protein